MTVNVTEHHIARGVRRSGSECPIALAASDAFGKPVAFHGMFLYGVDGKRSVPISATKFAIIFDNQFLPVSPFTFEVDDHPLR